MSVNISMAYTIVVLVLKVQIETAKKKSTKSTFKLVLICKYIAA